MSENYDLTTSSKALGKLYPILKDKHGNIIDGFHRQNADPDWPAITIDLVDNPQKLELARLAVNFCRRHLPATEIEQRIAFLIKSGMKPEEIAKETGISLPTVYRHIPQELKDKQQSEKISEAMKEKSEVVRESLSHDRPYSNTQDTTLEQASIHKVVPKAFDAAEVKTCERCGVQTTEPKTWHGHTLCSSCEKKADFNPAAYDGYFRYQERGKAGLVPKPKVASQAVEPWANREARMHPQKSKMEEELLLVLGNDDALRPVVTDRSYPIVTLTPDFVFPRHNLAVFLDGKEVHAKRQDRDEALRDKLFARHNLKVLSITYSGNSESEKHRIIAEIKGAV